MAIRAGQIPTHLGSSSFEVDCTFLSAGSKTALPSGFSSKRHVVIEEDEVGDGQQLVPYSRLGWLAAVIDQLTPINPRRIKLLAWRCI